MHLAFVFGLSSIVLLLLLASPAGAQGGQGRFTRLDGLPSDGVTALAWDGAALWVGTLDGLGQIVGERAQTVEFPLEKRSILAVYADGEGVWVGTADGIAHFEGGVWQTWQRGDEGLRSDWATSFATHQGALVAGTYTDGVQRWNGTRWERVGDGIPNQVTALASTGPTLWAGTPRGVWAWDGSAWSNESPTATLSEVRALLVTENTLWAGTRAGLFRRGLAAGANWQAVTGLEEADINAMTMTPQGLVVAIGERAALVGGDGAVQEAALPGSGGKYIAALHYDEERLFMATLGDGVRWQGAASAGAEEAAPKPPVVLLHGLGDSNTIAASNFRFLAQWLRQDGYTVTMASYDDAAPLLDNVAAVRRTVRRVQRETGQEKVILIAHSFGGLVGRAFVASGTDAVAGLVTLGTPHAGVRMAYDFIVSDLERSDRPADRELLPEHAALLAPFGEQGRVPQLHIGGDILPRGGLAEGLPPNDGRITAASATAAPGATRLESLAHGWTVELLGGGIPSFLWPDDLYRNTLRPWMQSVAAGAAWQSRTDPLPLPEAGFTQRVGAEERIEAGETVTVPVTLRDGATTWFVEGGATMDLVGPEGTRYRHDRALVGETVAHLPSRDNAYLPLDLWTTQDEAGAWRAVLTNATSDTVTATLSLIEPDGPTLNVTIDNAWVEPGAPITVTVRGAPEQPMMATLSGEEVRLNRGADGTYRGELSAPPEPGYYPLRVRAGDLSRWAVVGVRSTALTIQGVEATEDDGIITLRLMAEGEGRVALGVRLFQGERLLETRLLGPLRVASSGTHSILRQLPAPDADDLRIEWQLFDASGALVPITPLNSLAVSP